MSRLLASLFGVGFLRPAPGTWGSLAALVLAWALMTLGGGLLLTLFTLVAVAAGLALARAVIADTGDTDPRWFVMDEVAGQWIALLPVAYGAERMSADPLALWPGWVAAFLLFRLLDVWKPGFIGRADRRGDALGLMLDDVWAGLLAALGVVVLAGLAHGVLMR